MLGRLVSPNNDFLYAGGNRIETGYSEFDFLDAWGNRIETGYSESDFLDA